MSSSARTSPQKELSESEQITPCSICEKVPENFVAMNCGHNYCLICLSKIYLSSSFQPSLESGGSDYQCIVRCELCNGLTELDSTSIEALEIFIQDFFSKSNEVYNEIIYEESNETNQTEEHKQEECSQRVIKIDRLGYVNKRGRGKTNMILRLPFSLVFFFYLVRRHEKEWC